MVLQPRPETIKELQKIVEDLLDATNADRTTIRVDTPNDRDYPVLAEARAPGVASLTGGMSAKGYKPYDIHQTPTLQFLKNERKIIVQRDARVDPPFIPELIEYYGTTGQVLTPLEHDGEFVGLVSAHSSEARTWTQQDIAAIEDATQRVQDEFKRARWIDLG